MSAYQRAPSRAFLVAIAKPACAVALAVSLGACSSARQPAGPQVFAWLAPEPPPQVAFNPTKVEADSLPAATPQPVSVRNMPDDPAASWSPNSGRSAASAWSTSLVGPASPDDSWKPDVAARADEAGMMTDDAGLPDPKSPEEAGICSVGSGWKCPQ
jgi:hypothetical protein